jgi:hypothetical protein
LRLTTIAGIARLAVRLAWAGLRHRPRPVTIAQRLAALPCVGLPLGGPVEIRWNDHLVPFIAAESDRDLAVALGLVHAHLRLAQMELLRRIAQGRLAEILGPVAVPFDHGLRLLDPARAVPAIEAALPDDTRDWVAGFVAGINHHLASAAEKPFEFRLLGIEPEPWTITDVLGIARLAAADVNWLLWMRLMRLPRCSDWPDIWARLIEDGTAPLPSLASGRDITADAFTRLVLGLGRAGSNALAVSGQRSATGQPWLAGDPHLSLSLPSVWLQAAYRSPSYHAAGLMIPSIPIMAIGRNPWIAWGGTNLHAASSELFDVSELPASEIAERPVRIAVRWSRPRDIVLRDTAHGPIISDAPLFGGGDGRALALSWVGHRPSDEMSALLAINRARDWNEFRAAAEGFAVPGQNLVYADRDGRLGNVRAAWLPRRAGASRFRLAAGIGGALGRLRDGGAPAGRDRPELRFYRVGQRPPTAIRSPTWLVLLAERPGRTAGGDLAQPRDRRCRGARPIAARCRDAVRAGIARPALRRIRRTARWRSGVRCAARVGRHVRCGLPGCARLRAGPGAARDRGNSRRTQSALQRRVAWQLRSSRRNRSWPRASSLGLNTTTNTAIRKSRIFSWCIARRR